jgi:hypothetical protein
MCPSSATLEAPAIDHQASPLCAYGVLSSGGSSETYNRRREAPQNERL